MAVLILAGADPDYYHPDYYYLGYFLPFNSDKYDLEEAIAIGFDGKFFKY